MTMLLHRSKRKDLSAEYISISPAGAGALLKPGETIVETQPPVRIYDVISKYIFGGMNK